jgi:hypothetical protein
VNNRVVFFGNDGGVCRADDVTTVGNDSNPPPSSTGQSSSRSPSPRS